jgi:hypothetical protein
MSQRVEVVSNLCVRKNLPEGSTQGLSAQYFRSILQVIYQQRAKQADPERMVTQSDKSRTVC